jgi:hypothetical protein
MKNEPLELAVDWSEFEPLDDGSEVEPLDDGSKVEPLDDGSEVEPLDDGSEVESLEDGSDVESLEDGSEAEPLNDGSAMTDILEDSLDGREEASFPDGIVYESSLGPWTSSIGVLASLTICIAATPLPHSEGVGRKPITTFDNTGLTGEIEDTGREGPTYKPRRRSRMPCLGMLVDGPHTAPLYITNMHYLTRAYNL